MDIDPTNFNNLSTVFSLDFILHIFQMFLTFLDIVANTSKTTYYVIFLFNQTTALHFYTYKEEHNQTCQ